MLSFMFVFYYLILCARNEIPHVVVYHFVNIKNVLWESIHSSTIVCSEMMLDKLRGD